MNNNNEILRRRDSPGPAQPPRLTLPGSPFPHFPGGFLVSYSLFCMFCIVIYNLSFSKYSRVSYCRSQRKSTLVWFGCLTSCNVMFEYSKRFCHTAGNHICIELATLWNKKKTSAHARYRSSRLRKYQENEEFVGVKKEKTSKKNG